MSIHDRDYYRNDPRSPGSFQPPAVQGMSITTWLIILNVCVFLFEFFVLGALANSPLPGFVQRVFYIWPRKFFLPWQPFTGAFFHADPWHILFNMWVLYMFGRPLELILGKRDFIVFYLVAALLAGLCYVVWGTVSASGGEQLVPALGASGAVMGVVVLYAFYRPRQVILLWFVFPLQIRWLAILIVGADLLMLLTARNSNIAHCAHLGGAAFGMIHYVADLRLTRILNRLRGREQPPPRLPDPFSPPPHGSPEGEMGDVERRVDELLNKISRQGLPSLTEEERQFLKDASKRYGP